MKYLMLALLACCLTFSLAVPPVHAFQGMDMDSLRVLAEKGDPESQTQLGVAYMRGTGVEQDAAKGVEWYRKAADQGYANAQWNLAFAYVRGAGVAGDYKEAARLFKLAADQEYPPAEYDLGMMYLQGLGVTRSRTVALDWITKSADHGYKEADAFLKSRGVVRNSEQEPAQAEKKAE